MVSCDVALRIRQEGQLPAFQQLGDVREIAITRSQIARILVQCGQYDEALRIEQEQLLVFQQLGDVREIAHTRFSIARIRLAIGIDSIEDTQAVLVELRESFKLTRWLGEADGIAVVGRMLGPILLRTGHIGEGRAVLTAVRDACLMFGHNEGAAKLDQQIGQLGE